MLPEDKLLSKSLIFCHRVFSIMSSHMFYFWKRKIILPPPLLQLCVFSFCLIGLKVKILVYFDQSTLFHFALCRILPMIFLSTLTLISTVQFKPEQSI